MKCNPMDRAGFEPACNRPLHLTHLQKPEPYVLNNAYQACHRPRRRSVARLSELSAFAVVRLFNDALRCASDMAREARLELSRIT